MQRGEERAESLRRSVQEDGAAEGRVWKEDTRMSQLAGCDMRVDKSDLGFGIRSTHRVLCVVVACAGVVVVVVGTRPWWLVWLKV